VPEFYDTTGGENGSDTRGGTGGKKRELSSLGKKTNASRRLSKPLRGKERDGVTRKTSAGGIKRKKKGIEVRPGVSLDRRPLPKWESRSESTVKREQEERKTNNAGNIRSERR